jgi:hypothetical protein
MGGVKNLKNRLIQSLHFIKACINGYLFSNNLKN